MKIGFFTMLQFILKHNSLQLNKSIFHGIIGIPTCHQQSQVGGGLKKKTPVETPGLSHIWSQYSHHL